MEDLIKALQIFLKYGNPDYPTNCSHDCLWIDIDQRKVSKEDIRQLEDLGFRVDDENDGFYSYKYGSC